MFTPLILKVNAIDAFDFDMLQILSDVEPSSENDDIECSFIRLLGIHILGKDASLCKLQQGLSQNSAVLLDKRAVEIV